MPNYRRNYVAGGTYFFTVVTYGRRPLFHDHQNCELLGNVLRDVQATWPFEVVAIVLLPDHLHTIWKMPSGDSRFSPRWSIIKRNFTKQFLARSGRDRPVSTAREREYRRGVWQARFWEHLIRDEDEFDAYFDYIHFNPVKYGYVQAPRDWSHSSFQRWVAQGCYDSNWGAGFVPDFSRLTAGVGEAE